MIYVTSWYRIGGWRIIIGYRRYSITWGSSIRRVRTTR